VLPGDNRQVGTTDTGAVDFDQDMVARRLGYGYIYYFDYILTLVADGSQQAFTSPACHCFFLPKAIRIELNRVVAVAGSLGQTRVCS
jgi:hypothetical protein